MSDKTAPKSQLRLEWVYGYRGHQCRNNLWYTATNEIVYFVAGVGVVFNVAEHKQRFFLEHDDDIVSLCVHPDRLHVATGQIGKQPTIMVWHSVSLQVVSILKGGHEHGVGSVAFDKEGQRLVSVGLDPNAIINVWDWRKGKVLATVRGHSEKVFDAQFSPHQANALVSCGIKHIKFWTLSGNTLTAKKGVFGKVGEIQTMFCLAFGPAADVTYSVTFSGDIYMWKGSTLSQAIRAAHIGPVYAIYGSDEGFVTGGKDSCMKLWDKEFRPMLSVDLSQVGGGYKGLTIRSLNWSDDRVLVGTQDSEVFEVIVRDREKVQCVMQGHAEGELWALAVHSKKPIFATGSDDRSVRIWNMQTNSLYSKVMMEHAVRSCAFNPDGTHLAVGMMDGSFSILVSKDLNELVHIDDRKEVIHEMKYSPDGQYIAVGSNDNFVDIYAVAQKYKRMGQCSGSSSFITHLDWSEDSKYIQTNSGAAEHLVFKMPTGKQVTGSEEIQNIRWATFTGVLGPEVNGIWAKYSAKNDVNASDAFFKAEVIVTGDDFGLVKLFRFPSLNKGAKFKKYGGHSAHVTNCRFSFDKSCVLTTGGGDHAIFQWRHMVEGATIDATPNQHTCVASDSEESDSDLSDIVEVDSDVEREKLKSYERPVYKEDVAALQKKAKTETPSLRSKKLPAPQDGLQLYFVHGYRGFDCRNNLFYLQSGEIVYHVAAVGIVYNKDSHSQRFYLGHTDDILCLCIHPIKDYIATGQVGRDPAIHVWDAETLKVLSILKGQHQRGICALDFSIDGKKLASVGLDDEHSIVIWDWRKGEKLATTRAHKGKIFVIKWNPYDTNKLVTVGDKHIKFWIQAGSGFTSNRGVFGNVSKQDTMLCVAFGKTQDVCFTGGANGSIYLWSGTSLSKCIKAHEGPCFAMHFMEKGFVTGGKDGVVSLWDDLFERCLKSYTITKTSLASENKGILTIDKPAIRAVVLGHGHILVGTINSEIVEVSKEGVMKVITQGHKEGELWGLAMHPAKLCCATVSDDKTLRVWDLGDQQRMTGCKILKQPGNSVCFSPDGKALAVGLKDGSFLVVNAVTLEDMVQFHHRKEAISDIRFSPDAGKYLAVASHDNFVDIYNVLTSKRVGICSGASSYITHVDWDAKGKLLMVNSGARELLFYEAPRGTRHNISAADLERMTWASWTSVLGPTCEGIWPPTSDVTDVNAACLSNNKKFLATGDDFGFVKLFQYPVKGKHAKFKQYTGHSAHVTNVRWSAEDVILVSVGGGDTAVMVWAHGKGKGVNGDNADSDTDSEEEGYDSDVAAEKTVDYTSKFNADPLRAKTGVIQMLGGDDKKDLRKQEAFSRGVKRIIDIASGDGTNKKNCLPKVADLELELILGFRGFDCRNNLHYLNDGSDIVYNAAGTGVVINLATGKYCSAVMRPKGNQSFYVEHNDDIISIAVNEHPKFKSIVATGQIGEKPFIKVWNAGSKKTLSVMQGFHTTGICALDFSCSGKQLLSVGLDAAHSLAVWNWQEGSVIASSAGHTQRIFHAEFRPDSESTFVTVGVKHVKFWTLTGNTLVGRKAILTAQNDHQQKMLTFLSIAFGADNATFTGAMSGDVFLWKDTTLSRVIEKAHHGPVFSMFTTLSDGLIVTGAKEKPGLDGGPVKLWDQEMKRCRAFQLNTGQEVDIVKSVTRVKGKIMVGTKECEFVEINEKSGDSKIVCCGHGSGELWGLAAHPSMEKFVSASDDGTVRLWDITNKKMASKIKVGEAARSVDVSPNGELIAVGLKNGGFQLITFSTFKVCGKHRDRGSVISFVRFSPNNQTLAVGSEECAIDFYDMAKGPAGLKRIGYCNGLQGIVMSIDFSQDGRHVTVGTSAFVSQVFEVPKGNEVKDKDFAEKLVHSSWSCVSGSKVVGIWPKDSAKHHINCADVTHSGNTIATGDDFGLIKLFDFPCTQKDMEYHPYVGHSAHVTNIRFTFDDRFLMSAGGSDSCIFVWKCK